MKTSLILTSLPSISSAVVLPSRGFLNERDTRAPTCGFNPDATFFSMSEQLAIQEATARAANGPPQWDNVAVETYFHVVAGSDDVRRGMVSVC